MPFFFQLPLYLQNTQWNVNYSHSAFWGSYCEPVETTANYRLCLGHYISLASLLTVYVSYPKPGLSASSPRRPPSFRGNGIWTSSASSQVQWTAKI